jgi:hypothetical protein
LASLHLHQFVTHHVGPLVLSRRRRRVRLPRRCASGSGKTLLLRAIADLDPHSRRSLL